MHRPKIKILQWDFGGGFLTLSYLMKGTEPLSEMDCGFRWQEWCMLAILWDRGIGVGYEWGWWRGDAVCCVRSSATFRNAPSWWSMNKPGRQLLLKCWWTARLCGIASEKSALFEVTVTYCYRKAIWFSLCVLRLPAAELGDHEEGHHTPAVVSEFRFIPNQTEEMEIAVLEEYKKCRYVCIVRPVYLAASCHCNVVNTSYRPTVWVQHSCVHLPLCVLPGSSHLNWRTPSSGMWRRVGFVINQRFGGTCHIYIQGRRNNANEERCWTVTNRASLQFDGTDIAGYNRGGGR
jgi:hypothetical protein